MKTSIKQLQINKTQSAMLITVTIATLLTVFCLASSWALLSKAAYQGKVISQKKKAAAQLERNVQDAGIFMRQYNEVFAGSSPINIIGGRSTTDPNALPPDGSNPKIVLDALPTTYDFPGLITSIESVLKRNNIGAPAIVGQDNSATADNSPSSNPQPVVIPLTISGSTTYEGAATVVRDLERSIRPMDTTKLSITGSSTITFNIDVSTYYQVAKTLNNEKKGVK